MKVNLQPNSEHLAASNKVLQDLQTNLLDVNVAGSFDVLDPATGEVIQSVPDITPDLAIEALGQADVAGQSWKNTTPRYRSDLLQDVYNKLIEHKDELAYL